MFVLSVGYFTWKYSETAILSLGEQLGKQTSLIAQEQIKALLKEPYQSSRLIKQALRNNLIQKGERDKLEVYIRNIVLDNKYIDNLGFGFSDGSYISYGHSVDRRNLIKNISTTSAQRMFYSYKVELDSDGSESKQEVSRFPNYDARVRPWFSEALSNKRAVWSSIFNGYATKELGITLSEPVYNRSGKFLGVVGSDVILPHLNEKLHAIKLTPNSLVYIVDNKDNLIAYNSESSNISNKLYKVKDSHRELIKQSYGVIKEQDSRAPKFGLYTLQTGNLSARYFVYFMPRAYVEGLNWHVAVVIPENDFFAQINTIKRSIVWVWILSLVLSLSLGLLMALFIIRSINQLRYHVNHIQELDDFSLKSHKIREFYFLAKDFFIMSQRLKKALKRVKRSNKMLEEQVLERTKELNKANNRLLQLSNTDSLTKIPNRRHFEQSLLDDFAQLQLKEIECLSILMCDVDHFKQYNDTYGHQSGDECLKVVAGVIKKSVRKSDTAARYGGEEFVVILPGASSLIAQKIANKIIERLAEKAIAHCSSKAAPYVSLSIGISTVLCEQNLSMQELLQRADQALYAAKSKGRNQSLVYTDEIESLI